MKLGCLGACSSSFVELKYPITPMYLMENIVEISTILIVYCNPSMCKELWVKRLVYMVRLSMTSQQGFLFFNLAMLKIARKLMDFFKKRKINWINTRKKNTKKSEFSVEKLTKIFPKKMLITLKRIIASFIFLVLQSIRPINPKLFGVNT